MQAFTYYGHREKLRIIGKEDLLEPLQKNALQIAKDSREEFKDLNKNFNSIELKKDFQNKNRMVKAVWKL